MYIFNGNKQMEQRKINISSAGVDPPDKKALRD